MPRITISIWKLYCLEVYNVDIGEEQWELLPPEMCIHVSSRHARGHSQEALSEDYPPHRLSVRLSVANLRT